MHRRKQLFFSKNSLSFKLPSCWFEFHWLDTCKSQETDLNKLSDLSPLVRWNEKTRVARIFKEVSGIETRRVELRFQRAAGSLNAFSWLLFFPKWRGFSVASLLFFLFWACQHKRTPWPMGRGRGFCAENQFEGTEWFLVKHVQIPIWPEIFEEVGAFSWNQVQLWQ